MAWLKGANLKGPAGPTGAAGPAGPVEIASASRLGGIKVGTGLAIDATTGVLSSSIAGNYLVKTGDAMTGPLRHANSGGVSTFNGTDVYCYFDGSNYRIQLPSSRTGLRIDNTTGEVSFPTLPTSTGGNASVGTHLITKSYLDNRIVSINEFLRLAGGTMTGTITSSADVDFWKIQGSTYSMIGNAQNIRIRKSTTDLITIGSTLTSTLQLVTPATATAIAFGSGGPTIGRKSATELIASATIECNPLPTLPAHLANKAYVDSKIVFTAAGDAAPSIDGLAEGALWVEFTTI
ncbi:hypothetical protein KBY79_12195 [Synechococcus lacustris C3-12m-Tous]|uniref:hypothetical protein n=2 Tax=Synechococcus TaxID=1129 RepID=UPI0020CE0BFB|nr:hypothetical protein [Synechococcus lacustris]MCP9925968.1 hypothetical protein [Synechococcus lacustris C3-12m-Tous]